MGYIVCTGGRKKLAPEPFGDHKDMQAIELSGF